MSDGSSLFTIRMERAREPGHPEGSSRDGYEFVAPLDESGRIDPDGWRHNRDDCLVSRFRDGQPTQQGRLSRRPGGAWYFDYDRAEDSDDEAGFRFGDETFAVGEYVSIKEQDGMHTYRITMVEPL